MKFLHLSDLHIGLKLYNYDLSEDQRYILDEIVRIAADRQPDAVVVAGDIYDKAVSSAEASALFDRFVSRLSAALPHAEIMMIAGNHDSGQRLNLYRSILSREHIHMIGLPPMKEGEQIAQVTLTDAYGPVHFFLLPFVKPSMERTLLAADADPAAKPAADEGADRKAGDGAGDRSASESRSVEKDAGTAAQTLSYDETVRRLIGREISAGRLDPAARNVLVSHQFYLPAGKRAEEVERMRSEIVTIGNIDQVGADVLDPFDYAALGHIHKPMRVGGENRRYSGTPIACSLSEAGQQKGILEVELKGKGDVTVQVLPLKPLREVRIIRGSAKEVLSRETDDYVQVVLTEEKSGTGAAGRKDAETATAVGDAAESGNGAAAAEQPLSMADLQEELRLHFPHLLEIRREKPENASLSEEASYRPVTELDPFEACCDLLAGRADDEELKILKEIINKVREEQGA